MFSTLTNTKESPARYILKAWIIAFVPTIVIAAAVGTVIEPKDDLMGQKTAPVVVVFLGMVVFSPVVETLLMVVMFWFLRKFTQESSRLVVYSAILWALLHSALWLPWGLIVIWAFVVFSTCYLSWEKVSVSKAIWITAATHAMLNLIPALVTAASML